MINSAIPVIIISTPKRSIIENKPIKIYKSLICRQLNVRELNKYKQVFQKTNLE